MSFDYSKAKSVKDAAKAKDDKPLLAGGMTLLPAIKLGLSSPKELIDLAGLKDLKGIKVGKNKVTIGAMTRHRDVETSAEIAKAIPALAKLAGGIGDPQVRNRGTIGGSLANNDPAADYPAAVLGLGATIVTDQREIDADDYFAGLYETALKEGEVVTAVEFPIPKRAGYAKFPHPSTRFALAGVFVAETDDGVRVAVTGAGEGGVYRDKALEKALEQNFTATAAAGVKQSDKGMASDIHAAADYRAHLVSVMAARAVESAG